uniref:CDK5RAP3-like protein n=1 Tax=Lotharella globosa TaxID=91324 RepID=A0A7S3ZBK1_9EUKA
MVVHSAWLLRRGKLKKKWQNDLRSIQTSTKEARKLLDVEMQEKFEGDAIGYFEVLKIISTLEAEAKEQGKNVKTFFGGYSSDLLRTWDEIRQNYLKDNIYIAESGRALAQRLKYDIPRMKKLVVESAKQLADLQRKVTDKEKLSKDWRVKFRAKCDDLGIRGVDVASELLGTLRELPAALETVAGLARKDDVGDAMNFYKDYVRFLHGFTSESKEKKSSLASEDSKFIPSLAALEAVRQAPAYDEKEVENGWALVDAKDGNYTDEAIPTGSEEGGAAGGIDWGLETEQPAEAKDEGNAEQNAATGGDEAINWDFDIEVEEDGGGGESAAQVASGEAEAEAVEIDWEISLDAGAAEEKGGAANTSRPKHILDDEKVRNELMDNLLEVKYFLEQRLKDLENGDPIASGQYKLRAPDLNLARRGSALACTRYLKAVDAAVVAMRDATLQRLLLIQGGERYVTRLADNILQLERNAERASNSISSLREREKAIRTSVSQTRTSLDRATEGCKEMQKRLEDILSGMFPDAAGLRIVGDINKL